MKVFKVGVTVTVLLLLVMMAMGQITGPDPQSQYRDVTQPIASGGLWRLRFHGGTFNIDMNTDPAGLFAYYNTYWGINAAGQMSVNQSTLNLNAPQTTLVGNVSGTAIWSMPFQGASYKKFLITFTNWSDSGTEVITFPTPFVSQPTKTGGNPTATPTTLTISNNAPVNGNMFVEGY